MSAITDTIAAIARSLGVDPNLAIADATVESGLNPNAVGDGGTSFGLFQLHRGGELGSLTPQQAFDPATNARRALSEFANVMRVSPGLDPGVLAARAQRPADPTGYAKKVDAALASLGAGASGLVSNQPAPASGPPALPDFTGLQTGLTGAGTAIGTAIGGIPGQIGHGIAGGALTTFHNLEAFAASQAVAIFVALVIVLVIFL